MKVYIVFEVYDGRIEVVFKTMEGAKNYCKTHEETYLEEYEVEE